MRGGPTGPTGILCPLKAYNQPTLINESKMEWTPSTSPSHQAATIMAKARNCCCTPEPYKHLLYLVLYFERVGSIRA